MSYTLSLGGTGFSFTNITFGDGFDNNIESLLKHPHEKIVKATKSNDKCNPSQFYQA